MYVIATVICPNFHFSVSPHVPFLNLLFEQIAIPTNIYSQNLASIQKRTSPMEFAHLAEKPEKGSISNLSTKVPPRCRVRARG